MDANKTTTNWIIAGLVALVVIIGGGWLIARERSGTTVGTASSTETVSTSSGSGEEEDTETSARPKETATPAKDATTAAAGENVTVSDQPAGNSVTVESVKVTKPSWVAIRDTRGWYPGWQWVGANQTSVVVPLKRALEAGQTYEAVIFIDDGDGSFELHGGDTLVVSSQGAPVSSTFKAQ